MEITLRLFATYRAAVGTKVIERQFDDEATVETVLRSLEAEFEDLEGELLEDGDLRQHINVLKNGREVLHMDGIETELDDGDTLSIFPPVAGGDR